MLSGDASTLSVVNQELQIRCSSRIFVNTGKPVPWSINLCKILRNWYYDLMDAGTFPRFKSFEINVTDRYLSGNIRNYSDAVDHVCITGPPLAALTQAAIDFFMNMNTDQNSCMIGFHPGGCMTGFVAEVLWIKLFLCLSVHSQPSGI